MLSRGLWPEMGLKASNGLDSLLRRFVIEFSLKNSIESKERSEREAYPTNLILTGWIAWEKPRLVEVEHSSSKYEECSLGEAARWSPFLLSFFWHCSTASKSFLRAFHVFLAIRFIVTLLIYRAIVSEAQDLRP